MTHLGILLLIACCGTLSAAESLEYLIKLSLDDPNKKLEGTMNFKLADKAESISFRFENDFEAVSCKVLDSLDQKDDCTAEFKDKTVLLKKKGGEFGKMDDITLTYKTSYNSKGLNKLNTSISAGSDFLYMAPGGAAYLFPNNDERSTYTLTLDDKNGRMLFSSNKIGSLKASDIGFVIGQFVNIDGTSVYVAKNVDYSQQFAKDIKEIMSKLDEHQKAVHLVIPYLDMPEMQFPGIATYRPENLISSYYLDFEKEKIWWSVAYHMGFQSSSGLEKHYGPHGKALFEALYILTEKDKEMADLDFVAEHFQQKAMEADGFTASKSVKSLLTESPKYDYSYQHPILFSKSASLQRSMQLLNVYDPTDEKYLTWFESAGYPVVHVKEAEKSFKLKQERFFWKGEKEEKSTTWTIPLVSIEEKVNKPRLELMDAKERDWKLAKNESKWMILNVNNIGTFRVNYHKKMWDALTEQLMNKTDAIYAENRAQLIDDAFSLARSTYKFEETVPDYDVPLELIKYLEKEDQYLPWRTASNAFLHLDSALHSNKDAHESFRTHIKEIISKVYKKYKLVEQKEKPNDFRVQRIVSSWACKLGVEECIQDVKSIINSEKPPEKIENLVDIILCVMARENITPPKEKVVPEETEIAINEQLTCSKNETVIKKILESNMFQSPHYAMRLLKGLLTNNPENSKLVVQHLGKLLENDESIEKTRKMWGPALLRDVVLMTATHASGNDLKTMISMIDKLKGAEEKDILEFAKSSLHSHMDWESKKVNSIKNYLNSGAMHQPMALFLLLSGLVHFVRSKLI